MGIFGKIIKKNIQILKEYVIMFDEDCGYS